MRPYPPDRKGGRALSEAGPRFASQGGVGGDVELRVDISLLSLRGVARNVVLSVAPSAKVLSVVSSWFNDFDPIRHRVRSRAH